MDNDKMSQLASACSVDHIAPYLSRCTIGLFLVLISFLPFIVGFSLKIDLLSSIGCIGISPGSLPVLIISFNKLNHVDI